MRRILTLLIILLTVPVPFAWAEGHFFVGARAAYSFLFLCKKHTFTNNVSSAKDTATSSGDGFQENLLFGYAYTFKKYFYLGAELSGGLSQLEEDSHDNYHNASYIDKSHTYTRINHQYAFSLKPGYWIANNTLLFATLGVSRANFYYKNTYYSTGQPDAVTTQNHDSSGLVTGLGVEVVIKKHWGLLVGFNYSNYQSYSLRADTANRGNKTTVTPRVLSGEIGVDYIF